MDYFEFRMTYFHFISLSTAIITLTILFHLFIRHRIKRYSYYNTLTELPNKSYLINELNKYISGNISLCVLFTNLDNFKIINETLGHTFGDSVLQKISKGCSKICSDKLKVYHWGGDEFVFVLINRSEIADIEDAVIKIQSSFNTPIHIRGDEHYLSASIGISVYPNDADTAEDLIRNADTAMHFAKNSGKNNYKLYNWEYSHKSHEKLELELKMKKALLNDEFKVYYQPKVNLNTGTIVGMEALGRWITPSGESIPPNKFIPIAEQSNFINELSEKIIIKACMDTKEWNQNGFENLKVSVNISAKQFNENLIPFIDKIINTTQISPKNIELEITETMAMKDIELSIKIILKLKKMGCSVALDDFGTGYSSLNYLLKLPVDIIKLDKSFILKSSGCQKERQLIKSIIELAYNINLDVIAEGIENDLQLSFISDTKCEIIQGYYYSRPVCKNEFSKLLNTQFAKINASN